ncbi:ABC transporter ATP-binding protein [Clostridium sp. D2Q-14]|uniref:ABC transporter ATP-binding protein n=1 Tax=Anaeromonas gelatinilytica TaxID=2683194 RepID=UPI00193C4865|nr:ABC transporter ATP-binding protein [Anaeromonas gelatinilytica]MBS4536293.1 ABC transporter ATP-binding protein [Anaeromonas gelatinilytica]
MLRKLRFLLGDDMKHLKKPIIFLIFDAVFNMVGYGVLFTVLLDLLNQSFTIDRIFLYTGIMLIAVIGRLILNSYGYAEIQSQGARTVENLRISMGDHIRNFNMGYFSKNSIGSLSNVMLNDLRDLETIITHNTSDLIKTSILVIYILTISFIIDVNLALIQLAIVLIGLPLVFIGGGRVKKVGKEKKKVMNSVISRIVEYLNGMTLFKAHNMTGEKFKRMEQSFQDFKKESIRTEVSIVPFVMIFQIFVELSFPLILVIGTWRFTQGLLGAQEFLTFIIISLALTNVFRTFAPLYGIFRYLSLATDKLVETYQQKQMTYSQDDFVMKRGEIKFEDVSFAYEEENVLKDISFIAKEGSMTALIGHSGSGKSTILNLIARFYDVDNGEITVDGIDVRQVKPDALMNSIAMVFQEVYLLNDTIYNNILVGNPKAKKSDVIEVAKIAHCHEFIMKLENGYDTIVGEGGSTVSGGEKQRISLARALLKDASIVLLDEATASLDADNEYKIRQSIQKLTVNKTVIVIAHRLNTIKEADQIIVLNQGEIKEIGNHKTLMDQEGYYYRMIQELEQAKEFSLSV